MKFTKNPPTKPGLYWYVTSGHKEPDIIELVEQTDWKGTPTGNLADDNGVSIEDLPNAYSTTMGETFYFGDEVQLPTVELEE